MKPEYKFENISRRQRRVIIPEDYGPDDPKMYSRIAIYIGVTGLFAIALACAVGVIIRNLL